MTKLNNVMHNMLEKKEITQIHVFGHIEAQLGLLECSEHDHQLATKPMVGA